MGRGVVMFGLTPVVVIISKSVFSNNTTELVQSGGWNVRKPLDHSVSAESITNFGFEATLPPSSIYTKLMSHALPFDTHKTRNCTLGPLLLLRQEMRKFLSPCSLRETRNHRRSSIDSTCLLLPTLMGVYYPLGRG